MKFGKKKKEREKNDSPVPYILKFELYVDIYICILTLKIDLSLKMCIWRSI